MENRWVINRVGLLNFWYYQNQIFQLAEGKMLLRGTNGSGKSLTMQSLFPVLFDGDTSAYRLDSFGSRDRKMEDYLLGEKGVSSRDDGIGYLFLEAKRQSREEYLTIGIGMHANRGGKLNKWFFAIENNERVGIDIWLYEELRKGELTPLTKKKLKNRLEGKGQIFETQRAYKEFVNRRIFGFETMEQFDELIDLLINLRSPKLSKEFRPSVIYGILRDSLPKLKEDDLLTLSKTIEQLDGHRERMEDLDLELKELTRFSKSYTSWREEFVGQIADRWLVLVKEKQKLEKSQKERLKENQTFETSLQTQEENLLENEAQLKALAKSIQELNQHEGMDLVRRGQELQDQCTQAKENLRKNEENLKRKQDQLAEQNQNLAQQQIEQVNYEKEQTALLEDNQQYLPYLRLENLDAVYTQKMQQGILKEEFSYWKSQVRKKQQHFQQTMVHLQQITAQEEQLKNLERALGEQQQLVDELQRDLRQGQQNRQAEIERWKTDFEQWHQAASFVLTQELYGETLHRMEQLQEDYLREEEVLQGITVSYQEALAKNQTETIPLENQKQEQQQQIQEKQQAILAWQNQKMPEINQRNTRKVNREQLFTQNYLPFYQGIDFLESVSLQERNRIEGALYASGILDSLISPAGLQLADDQQILPNPQFFGFTLANYLQVTSEVDVKLQPILADVLQSIIVDEVDPERPVIFTDGSYQIANLRGEMPLDYEASYIGVASQERYRQEMIAKLRVEIERHETQIRSLEQAINAQQEQRERIMQDYEKRPSGSEVYEAIRQLEQTKSQYDLQQEQLSQQQQQTTTLSNQIKNEKSTLHRNTKDDQLPLKIENYEEASQYAENYAENLEDAYQIALQIQGVRSAIKQLEQQVQVLQEEADERREECTEWSIKVQELTRLVADNLQQQKLINVEELQQQLSLAITEQRQREDTKEQTHRLIHELGKQIAVNQNSLEQLSGDLAKVTHQESHWQQLFTAEAIPVESMTPVELAENQRTVPNIKKLKDKESNVLTQFNFLADRLQNYQPRLLNQAVVELTEEEELQLGDFGNYNNYKHPVFTAEGQRQTTSSLLERLTEQKLILQDLLKKDDEKLFKTIILESVGNILRSKIKQAMQWVEQIDQLLQSRQNSSGLKLSLQWKGIGSTSEQDLGTNRLVALLQKPIQLLSEADREAISRHFQERVYYAQEQVQENTDNQSTLYQAIAQVLDYRDWFEFELKYKRANEGYHIQSLTDRRFNQFSGGEKAITMYLPLFAAVYSRYLDAEKFCPRMITLDEAFAGIDEQNIADLFEVCEQLGFNYVMNSQALFGDYPTVSKLMIYELLRPQNINLVTPIQYYWDGRKKHLLLEEFANDQ